MDIGNNYAQIINITTRKNLCSKQQLTVDTKIFTQQSSLREKLYNQRARDEIFMEMTKEALVGFAKSQ